MATTTKSRKSPAAARPSAARPSAAGTSRKSSDLKGTLEKLGIDDSVVDVWRVQAKHAVASRVQNSIEDFDVHDAIELAKKYASMSSEKLKELSKNNPKTFYGGLAAILVGAGLLTAAAKTAGKAGSQASSGKSSARKSAPSRRTARSESDESPLDL